MSAPDRRLLVVSNRLPVVLEKTAASWELKPSSGGLVTALAPVLSLRGGLWIGWPGLALEPGGGWEQVMEAGLPDRGYELAPVLLSEEEVHGFYEGFSNAVLWPLFHDLVSSCDFQPAYWYAYLEANRKFAEQVVARSRPDDFVWVHDYQLIHVAEMVRERAADRQIGFFLHIPFPPLDLFLKLPWRAQILGALLAYDLLGFQTQRDRRNFLNCLENLLPEVEITDGQVAEVRVGGRTVRVGDFPIGIDAGSFAERAASTEVEQRTAELRRRFEPRELIVGVDRLDYTKGLPERLMAYRDALERLFVLDDLPAWQPSRNFISQLALPPKHHLADP
ncbi:MAG TPA: trehalose-6-phosphate synthase, partial [Thermoanaerobaculia bacterium]|nr:trehalose-6-phosphate synthase [Thermoanaerobaculia bacterium]